MKSEYKKPTISVEVLLKEDILLVSGEGEVPGGPTPDRKIERENVYRDFASFVFSGKW